MLAIPEPTVSILGSNQEMQHSPRPLKNSLHTRSLRDPRSSLPPKSTISIKSRHRAAQVFPGPNGVHTISGDSPGSLLPLVPVRPLLISVPSFSHSPMDTITIVANRGDGRTNIAISPCANPSSELYYETPLQISGTSLEFKDTSDFQVSARLRRVHSDNTLSTHELRQPHENPMKTRRYCTDFGLEDKRRRFDTPQITKQSTPDNTSIASTPLAVYTETNSDVSSLYEANQFEFPHPPDTGSPLFPPGGASLKDTKKKYIDARLRKYLTTSPSSSLMHGYWDLGTDTDRYLNDIGRDLELDGEELLNNMNPLTRLQKELASQRSGEISASRVDSRRRKLLHARSASSVLPAQVPRTNSSKSQRVLDSGSKLDRPTIEHSDSLRRLELSLSQPESLGSRTYPPAITSNPAPRSTTFTHPPKTIAPSLASAGRQKPTHRTHLSVPLAGLGLSTPGAISANSRPLASPFHHRATKSQPMIPAPKVRQADVQNPTSFMDITPEQKARGSSSGARREKIRKLLARASSGVLSWGRHLASTKLQR